MLVLTEPIAQNRLSVGPLRKACVQRRDLDRVAERRAGAVRLDVADRVGRRRRPSPAPRRSPAAWPSTLGAV